MKRREFIRLIGGAAAGWPLGARAQRAPSKLPSIGLLDSTDPSTRSERLTPFTERLRELGWIEGTTVSIEYRWAEGRNERSAEIAAEFVRLNVDVIVTAGTPTTAAAKRATSSIPIVFVGSGDPLGSGLVASLARPGGNVTGLSNQSVDVLAKRLQFVRQALPGLARLAIMADVDNMVAALEMREAADLARAIGIDVAELEIHRADDIASAIQGIKGRVDALYVAVDGLTISRRTDINNLALGAMLPTMHAGRDMLEGGGLMSYGANARDLFRRAADLVDKILRGAKPLDIPVEQPTKFDFVINLKTAKALDLTIPPQVLALADEVIE